MLRYASACLIAAAVVAAPVSASSPAVPQAVAQAAQFAAATNAGAVVHERHIDVNASAGPAHFSQSNEALLLMIDGTYKHIHYSKIVENGKPVSADEVAKRENQNNADFDRGAGFFKQPFDRRYLAEYAYDVVPCTGCAAGVAAVHFTSSMRDDQHGDGIMHIESATGRVLDLHYTPFVFPEHANSGTTTETFGEPIAGLWTIVRIDRVYGGRVLFVSGHGTMAEVLDHFHRFPDQSAGVAFYRSSTL